MVKTIVNPASQIPYFRYYPGSQTTTNIYVDHTRAWIWIADLKRITIVLRETNVNNVEYSIDVSSDNTNWVNLKTDQDLIKNTIEYEILENVWRYVRVQIRSDVADTHGTVDLYIMGERM